MTFPALLTGFKPVIPVTVSCGLQVLFNINSKGFFEQFSTPSSKANYLTLPVPINLASFTDS